MRSREKTLGLALLLAATAAPALAETLSGPEIKDRIGGELVRLSTPYGITLPLVYRDDGVVAGDISGFSIGSMLAPSEEGRWWVKDDRLCQKWPTWYEGRTYCFTITSLGPKKIAWTRDDGLSGTATMGR
ncbi:hypothetical protein [Ancylobacter polymorphus]|uniref:Dihydrodipicolinate reductase n=1 Tax=Ancylobacter polymorphus TaxID=223390 RepID=A0A9E7A685_9HYPH|nr:hypothetical protein [Ancylobacter polymorphus]UOK70368.1 hypothetical protein K9D25_16785 [Ancylobacter polymorphus]